MILENLKTIIHKDCRYYFISTDFDFVTTSKNTKDNKTTVEDLYQSHLFLGQQHLFSIGLSLNTEEKKWEISLSKKTSCFPLPKSFEEKHKLYPDDYDIKQDFHSLLKNFDNIKFLKNATLPELLESYELPFKKLLYKKGIFYEIGNFSDMLMKELEKDIDFKNPEIKEAIFKEKEKTILYLKLKNKKTYINTQIIRSKI